MRFVFLENVGGQHFWVNPGHVSCVFEDTTRDGCSILVFGSDLQDRIYVKGSPRLVVGWLVGHGRDVNVNDG